jgi:hypothetical protein
MHPAQKKAPGQGGNRAPDAPLGSVGIVGETIPTDHSRCSRNHLSQQMVSQRDGLNSPINISGMRYVHIWLVPGLRPGKADFIDRPLTNPAHGPIWGL